MRAVRSLAISIRRTPDILDPPRRSAMPEPGTLIVFCGKMAAGKSTLARQLARRDGAVLLVQDELLEALFPGQIVDIPGYVSHARRLNAALTGHICALLSNGTTVVLDFPGNTRAQRAWFRTLFEAAGAAHELHFIDASDELCKRQLRERSAHRSPGAAFTTDDEFDAITRYFEPPADDERFNVIRH
jgi:predicted kinase